MYIPIILGTAREGRESEKAANFVFQEVKKYGLETKILDVRDYRINATDRTGKPQQAQMLKEEVLKSDALIVVSPEYNHGYPGELKMMIDLLFKEFSRKPVGICGVSSGGMGGVRMVEQLKLVFVELDMIPIRESVYFSTIQNLFDDNGTIKDESYYERVKLFLDKLVSHIKNK